MPGLDVIVVGVIVAVALAWAARGVWRAARRKPVCSDCAASGGCPVAGDPDASPRSSECGSFVESLDHPGERP